MPFVSLDPAFTIAGLAAGVPSMTPLIAGTGRAFISCFIPITKGEPVYIGGSGADTVVVVLLM